MMTRKPSPLALVLIAPIRFYQRFITPYTPATCRFYPTCSSYAVSALREHGAVRGTWLTLRRLGRCHPWSTGGVDHVPPRRERIRAPGSSISRSSVASSTGPLSGSPWNGHAQSTKRQSAVALPTDRSTAA